MMLPDIAAVATMAVSVCVGLIFLTAGATKLRHRALLPGVIANYRLLPNRLEEPVAALLPFVELALGLALILGLAPLPVLFVIALLLGFALAMAINIRRGRTHIDCGCGHPALRQPLSWMLVGRNLLLALLLAPRLLSAPPLSSVDMAVAAAAGLALCLITLLVQSVAALAASPVHRRS
jgi:uncharacterized membrane protein YphA (DoxX/SURF4 family)